jgi:hypothetical protein
MREDAMPALDLAPAARRRAACTPWCMSHGHDIRLLIVHDVRLHCVTCEAEQLMIEDEEADES